MRSGCFSKPSLVGGGDKDAMHMKKQQSMTQRKEQNKSPETNSKKMEMYELPDRELKITVSKLNDPKEYR